MLPMFVSKDCSCQEEILISRADPLLMNAFNTVNLAAAVLLTSAENARELGVPEDKWIYPLGGAGRKERGHFWERPNFHHSDAISIALDECLALSGVRIADIDILDLYS